MAPECDKLPNFRSIALPLVPLLLLFLWTSIYGVNFGVHWDENRSKFDSVKNSLDTGMFMQAMPDPAGTNVYYYTYGGVNYFLTWLGFVPEIAHFLGGDHWTRQALSDAVSPSIYSDASHVRVRGIYVVLCSLAIIWIYALCLVMGRGRLEAFLAAAILAGSWEFAYHSRWVAPDVLMMQFVLLSFLCLAIGRAKKKIGWFYLAAVAAGLAAGTKYPAGLTVLFLLAGAAHMRWQQERSVITVCKQSLALGGTALGTFVLTTPGVLLDPFSFFGHIQYLRMMYASGHYGYTVTPGMPHFFKILGYYALQLFSHYWSISIFLTVFCLAGIVALCLERRLFNYLFFGLALAYVFYFSRQSELVVRNVLIAVPFLCVAAARGITLVGQRLGSRWKWPLTTTVGLCIAINFGWEIYAADQIKKRHHLDYFMTQFLSYVKRSPADKVLVSAKLWNSLHTLPDPIPDNIVIDPNSVYAKAAFFQTEGPDALWEKWPSNWWGMYETTFGALEVNLDAYPTFIGNQRILLTTARHFRRLPITSKEMTTP